jgi:hypothetical protein
MHRRAELFTRPFLSGALNLVQGFRLRRLCREATKRLDGRWPLCDTGYVIEPSKNTPNSDVPDLATADPSDSEAAAWKRWEEEQLPILKRESAAFEKVRENLHSRYGNEFVAFHNGEVVDHDQSRWQLAVRVAAAHPGKCVLIRRPSEPPSPPITIYPQ